ncbi:MAG: cupin domain-containing protein [Hyphomicrobiaceae bacterium]
MKPVANTDRVVRSVATDAFTPWLDDDGNETGWSYMQLGDDFTPGVGFHMFKMEPGSTSTPHEHTGAEHFYVVDGTLIENDGTVYRKGDLVLMKKGTQHSSHTPDGCLLAVYIETMERNLPKNDA